MTIDKHAAQNFYMRTKHPDIEQQLIDAMNASGLTLAQLARQSGVDLAALSRLRSGERSLTLPSAAKLARALRLELRRAEE